MRINEITNLAYVVTVALTVLSGAAFILSGYSADQERRAVEEHIALDSLAEDLELGAELRSDDVRLYVLRGDDRFLARFYVEDDKERARETAIGSLREFGITSQETVLLGKVEQDAEALEKIEQAAIDTYRGGDREAARAMVINDDHIRLQDDLTASVSAFRSLIAKRTTAELQAARDRSDWLGFAARAMLAMTAAVFLGVLYFILKKRIAVPLTRMTGIVNRLAQQDYAVEVPMDARRDEIGEMTEAIHIFRENGLERSRLDAERRADQHTKDLILQMMRRLQACETQADLAMVSARFLPQIFPGMAGQLFLLNEGRTALGEVARWLDPVNSFTAFPPSACWALRRGHPHISHKAEEDVPCQHLDSGLLTSLCIPLTAQGDTLGILYLEERSGDPFPIEASRLYLEMIAENVGLAVANLQLREKLTDLAIRDTLTGLYNRRSLDEALNRHIRDHPRRPIACMMIDIDHFKRFNDGHGHDAGDAVIRHVAQVMVDTAGDATTIYRYGGEEFAVLMQAELSAAVTMAERLRVAVASAALSHRGRILGHITISIGISAAPAEGSAVTLMDRADAALLQAKAAGRNAVIVADMVQLGSA